MANKRPPHRKGTTGHAYRQLQAEIFKGTTCARCGNTRGPIIRNAPCTHPTHQHLPGCPTHPLAPSLGHKQDLQFGGKPLDPRNAQLEHLGCNARAGVTARMQAERATQNSRQQQPPRESWDW